MGCPPDNELVYQVKYPRIQLVIYTCYYAIQYYISTPCVPVSDVDLFSKAVPHDALWEEQCWSCRDRPEQPADRGQHEEQVSLCVPLLGPYSHIEHNKVSHRACSVVTTEMQL